MKKIEATKSTFSKAMGVLCAVLAIVTLVHFEQYPIEDLKVPVLLVHARDDTMAKFSVPEGYCVERSLHRYPHLTKLIFEVGGIVWSIY